MGGSRSRASRRRPSQSLSRSSVDIVAVSHQIHSALQETSGPPELLSLLLRVSDPSPPSFQDELGAALHLHILQSPTASAHTRYRLAQLCSALPHWHASSPSAALSAAGALATASLSPSTSRDASALSASLSCVAAIARAALPNRPAREQVERHVPTLVEPIHVALFRSRPAPLADCNSDSGSATHSDRDALSSYAPRLHTVRYAALDALQSLADVASRALIPFWGMFLPDRDGVPRRAAQGRDTLASIILFERDMQLRSTAVSTITALLASTRTFIQKATQLARPTKQQQTSISFTSASSRVLRASAAMYTVVATALDSESSGVVTAKLAKLGAELAWCMPVPAVPQQKAVLLATALRNRLLDEANTDLTSRAAAASAIAVVMAKSGENVPLEEIEQFCHDFIRILRFRKGGNQPAMEILTVLRNVISIRPHLLRRMLCEWKLPLSELAIEESSTGQSLHCIRIVETYVAQTIKIHEAMPTHVSCDAEMKDLHAGVALAWELYHTVLQDVVLDGTHPGQNSAINALGHILQLTGAADSLSSEAYATGFKLQSCGSESGDSTAIEHAVDLLREVIASNVTETTKIGSIRSLACVPVKEVSVDVISEIVALLDCEMRSVKNGLIVRGKAMGSYGYLMESILREWPRHSESFFSALCTAASFAAHFLNPPPEKEIDRNSRGNKSAVESSDIAAINLVVCAYQETLNYVERDLGTNSATAWRSRLMDHAQVLANILRGEKPVNTKCMCCRAVRKILTGKRPRCAEQYPEAYDVLEEAVSWSLENGDLRLQLICADILRDLSPSRSSSTDCLQATTWNVNLFEKSAFKFISEKRHKEKSQLSTIQDTLADVVCQYLQKLDNDHLQNLSKRWRAMGGGEHQLNSLQAAVFRHLSLPSTVTRCLRLSAKGQLTAEQDSARIFLDSLSENSHELIRRALTVKGLSESV